FRIHGDAVRHLAGAEAFECPAKMLGRDPEHGAAHAQTVIERNHQPVRVLLRQAANHMDFRAHGPSASWRSLHDAFDDVFRRAHLVRLLADFPGTFRVRDHANARVALARALHVLRAETLVYGAVPLPQVNTRVTNLTLGETAIFLVRIPH